MLKPLWTAPDSAGASMAQAMGVSTAELVEQLPALAGMTTGRMAAPEEIASLVLLLASDVAPSIRGSELVIDGGLLKAI